MCNGRVNKTTAAKVVSISVHTRAPSSHTARTHSVRSMRRRRCTRAMGMCHLRPESRARRNRYESCASGQYYYRQLSHLTIYITYLGMRYDIIIWSARWYGKNHGHRHSICVPVRRYLPFFFAKLVASPNDTMRYQLIIITISMMLYYTTVETYILDELLTVLSSLVYWL